MLLLPRTRRAKTDELAAVTAQFRARIRDAFGLAEEDTVAVNEIACPDPGCPDIETIVLIMRPGRKTQAVKFGGPLADVSDADLTTAAADVQSGRAPGLSLAAST